ncbi:hypothetical protein [Salinicoccus halodurans]|uniref:Uncharacterized protein n=1 Tax=Salinicoccus halodurans TaxID=407035 RepID=A0A0F7HL63_9STAP|nr:hypothetical protein [Salinicoccus halodurans]AKG74266.1 hypothetical protein AAT16_08485 [Salinicoccus halodurans]SFK93728.1 hypothetical protein SAMN05216235_2592 [Salinicoccus halodurans]
MNLSDETYKKIISEIMKQQHGAGNVFNFMVKLHQVEDEFTVDKPVEDTLDLIREITVPIEMEDIPSDEYLFYIGTGFKEMNPAVEHLKVSENDNRTTVTLLSNAAEGLIKQKSNKKAIKTIKTHLGLLENM